MSRRPPLDAVLARQYRFDVIADPDGGYVISYPDLPGCMTQVESINDVPAMATEIRELWLESVYQQNLPIPEPSYPEEYSGKFNVRLPRSVHRKLVQQAELEGVSLNQLVATLLAAGLESRNLLSSLERLLDSGQFGHIGQHVVSANPRGVEGRQEFVWSGETSAAYGYSQHGASTTPSWEVGRSVERELQQEDWPVKKEIQFEERKRGHLTLLAGVA